MKKVITAISLLHKGERIVIEANIMGKFKVPVTTVTRGQLKTKMRNLTARQVVEHDVIKSCDPTLYLTNGNRVRVFHGGDSSYLPAHVDGIITKHDKLTNSRTTPEKRKAPEKNSLSFSNYCEYDQAHFDMYGVWPYEDDTDG